MENNENKPAVKTRITSTIVLGILAVFVLAFVIIFFAFDPKTIISSAQNSSSSSSSVNGGEVIAEAMTLALFAGVFYVYSLFVALASSIGLVFSILNRKAPSQKVRIFNIVYDVIFSVGIIFIAVKFILVFVS